MVVWISVFTDEIKPTSMTYSRSNAAILTVTDALTGVIQHFGQICQSGTGTS